MMTGSGDFEGKRVILLALTPEEVKFLSDDPCRVAVSLTGESVGQPDLHEIRIVVATDQQAFLDFVSPSIDKDTVVRGLKTN